MAIEVFVGLAVIVIHLVITIWAATDAKKRGYPAIKSAFIFFLVLFIPLLGLILYFVLRPSGKFVPCRKCRKLALPNLKECPHCGLDKPRSRGQQPPAGQYQQQPSAGQYQQQPPAGQHQQQPPPPPPPVAKQETRIKCPHCGQMVESTWKTCPHCSRQKSIQVDSFKGSKSTIKIKCGCKNVFTVNLEFRKRVRKNTHLRGTYVNHSQKGARGDIVVKNVSVSGLEFSTYDVNPFEIEDELTVEFNLDDEQHSEITKDVIVRDVRQKSFGC